MTHYIFALSVSTVCTVPDMTRGPFAGSLPALFFAAAALSSSYTSSPSPYWEQQQQRGGGQRLTSGWDNTYLFDQILSGAILGNLGVSHLEAVSRADNLGSSAKAPLCIGGAKAPCFSMLPPKLTHKKTRKQVYCCHTKCVSMRTLGLDRNSFCASSLWYTHDSCGWSFRSPT